MEPLLPLLLLELPLQSRGSVEGTTPSPPSASSTSTTSRSFSPSMSISNLREKVARTRLSQVKSDHVVPLSLPIDTSRPIDSPAFEQFPFPLAIAVAAVLPSRFRRQSLVDDSAGAAAELSAKIRATAIERANGRCRSTRVTWEGEVSRLNVYSRGI